MIDFKHYTNISPNETNGYSFKHYIDCPQTDFRFTQFIEGTITELIPDDFRNVTELSDYCIYRLNNLERIEMSDEITKISWDAICYIPNIKEIVFSSNLTELSIWTLNNDEIFVIPIYNNNIILDFSKAKQIPQIVEDNEGFEIDEDFKYL